MLRSIDKEDGMEKMFDYFGDMINCNLKKKGTTGRRTLRNAILLIVNTRMMIVSSNSEGALISVQKSI